MMDKFFKPKSVAIIGASRNPEKVGYVILKNFVSGFKGKIYPINPKANEILGLKAYPSVLDVDDEIDLAVVCVKPEIANKVVKECGKKGVKAIVMITSGYREIGREGAERERELKEIIEKYGMRLIGPNCIGIYVPKTGVDTLFIQEYKMKKPGNGGVAFISQSGAFGLAMLDWMADEGMGISKFVSYGNATDVDESILLEYLAKDKETKVIAMYLEGIKEGKRFIEAVKKARKCKDIVIFKGGKHKAGQKAAMTHTGSLAGNYLIFSGVLGQLGCVEAKSVEELFDFSQAFCNSEKGKGKKIAIITNGGGFGVIASDFAKDYELELAEFEKKTIEALKNVLPEYASIHNPLDLIGDADAERYKKALEIVSKDKNVAGMLVITLLQTVTLDAEVVDVISSFKRKCKKPLVVVASGSEYTKLMVKSLQKEKVAAYPTVERGIKALAKLLM